MAYPASDQKPPCAAGCSRAQGPSGASPARSSARRTPGASDNTSPRSRRSGGLRPPCSGLVRPEHRPAATSRRSLQAGIASLPLQSSLMSKTYLKSDHFNGGGSPPSRQQMTNETALTLDVAKPDNVKSCVTDPHRPKDFLDPTEIRTFLDAAKAGRQGVRDHLLFLMMY